MLQNHYLKLKVPVNKTLPGPSHSVVLNVIPNDRLVIHEEIVKRSLMTKDVSEVGLTEKGCANIIEDLVSQGFVKILIGSVLERKLGV